MSETREDDTLAGPSFQRVFRQDQAQTPDQTTRSELAHMESMGISFAFSEAKIKLQITCFHE